MDYRTLALKDDPIATDYENIPEQRTGGRPLIPPGRYVFEIPKDVAAAWVVRETTVAEQKVQRVAVESDRDHPIVLAAVLRKQDESLVGEVWYGSISNVERNRARKGEPANLVSDMTYLLRDGFKDQSKPKVNREFIKALNTHAGKRFAADNEWSTYCNKTKVRFIEVDGQAVEDPDKRFGCGANYYQNTIPRDHEGYFQERFTCACGASLRCFQNLVRFGPAPENPDDIPF